MSKIGLFGSLLYYRDMRRKLWGKDWTTAGNGTSEFCEFAETYGIEFIELIKISMILISV